MLAGYYDDSYDNGLFVVGGFVSEVPRWEQFTDEWVQELARPPAISYYKAYDANVSPALRKPTNQFRGFSRGMIRSKEERLARVIARHADYAVFSTLNRADFTDVVAPLFLRPKRGQARFVAHEYHWPFHGCIQATVRHLEDNNINDQVDFFFDEQGKVGKWARDVFDQIKVHPKAAWMKPYVGVCVPHDDKKVVALQAADLFASRARKLENATGKIKDPVLSILGALPCKVRRWKREEVERLASSWQME